MDKGSTRSAKQIMLQAMTNQKQTSKSYPQRKYQRNTTANKQLTVNSFQGSTAVNTPEKQQLTDTTVQHGQQLTEKQRSAKQLLNQEVDAYLQELYNKELINSAYEFWYAKCIYTIGIPKVNKLAIQALSGTKPQYLFGYLLKGAMMLYNKQQEQSKALMDKLLMDDTLGQDHV